MQRFWTKRILLKDSKLLARLEDTVKSSDKKPMASTSNATDWKRLQSMLAQLRKAANHP
jgi:hypothetical protein